jgi:hypothetical protein
MFSLSSHLLVLGNYTGSKCHISFSGQLLSGRSSVGQPQWPDGQPALGTLPIALYFQGRIAPRKALEHACVLLASTGDQGRYWAHLETHTGGLLKLVDISHFSACHSELKLRFWSETKNWLSKFSQFT